MPPKNQDIKQKQCCNKFNKDCKNGPHQKNLLKTFLHYLNHFQKRSVSLSEYIYFISWASTEEIHTKHKLQPKLSYADASEHKKQQKLATASLPSLLVLSLSSFPDPRAAASLLGNNQFTLNPHLQSPPPHIEEALEKHLWHKYSFKIIDWRTVSYRPWS